MAIKFVNVEPAAEKPDEGPAVPAPPSGETAPQDETAARPEMDERRPAPRGRKRTIPAAPRPAEPEDGAAASEEEPGGAPGPAALPGLEPRPKPRRRGRPPYWGFG